MRHNHDDDILQDGVLRDGQVGRVRMMMRDGAVNWKDEADRYFSRSGVKITAADGSTQGLHKPGYRIAPTAPRNDALANSYAAYDASISSAYKVPTGVAASERGAQAGDQCTIDGWPGHLRMMPGVGLQCVKDPTADSRGLTMDAIYQSYDRDLRDAWRTR